MVRLLKRTKLRIEGFYIYGSKVLPSGTSIVAGAIGRHAGGASTYRETRTWPSQPFWADSHDDVENFAVFYHAVREMRKKYPFMVLYVVRVPPSADVPSFPDMLDLPLDLQQRYKNTPVRTRFGLKQDGDFHEYDRIEAFLFDVGTGEFSDFGGIVAELSRIHGAFLLSTQGQDLQAIREVVESTTDPGELRECLLTHFAVFFAPDDESDFLVATRDPAIVAAFLRNPKFPR